MTLFKQLFLAAITALLVACGGGGGGGGGATSATSLAVTISGAGTVAANGQYNVASGSVITVTCNMACTVAPSALNAAYTNTSSTATSWTGTMVGSNIVGNVTTVASASGQTSVNTVINISPALIVTVTGAGAGNSPYAVANNTQVTLTCNMTCSFIPSATGGATYSGIATTSTSWSATLKGAATASGVSVTASAAGQTAVAKSFTLAAISPIVPLTTAELTTLTKSANTANFAIAATAAEAQYLFTMVSTSGKPPASTGANQQFPTLSSTGTRITSPCVTGSYKASWSIANSTTVATDDYVEITYTNCVKSNGAKFNGKSSLTMVVGSSATSYYGELDLINFVKTTSAGTIITVLNSALNYSYTNSTAVLSGVLTSKKEFGLSGSLTATLSATASNLQAGLKTYTSTNIFNSVTYFTAPNTNVKYASSFDSSDGTYTYVVTNNTPSVYTAGGAFVSNGNTSIVYNAAKLDVDHSNLSTTVTGVNTNGSAISAINLGANFF
jgi:hypothetical protein